MKPSPLSYCFSYWAITLPVLIALSILLIRMILGPEPTPERTGLRWVTFLIGGLVLIGHALRYGPEWVKGTVLSLISFVVFWLLLEGVCGLILHWRQPAPTAAVPPTGKAGNETRSPKSNSLRLIHNKRLGTFRPAPGQYEIVYPVKVGAPTDALPANRPVAVTYTIDSLCRRATPFTRSPADTYALFLGCSFTYGEAVADTSTLPYFFGQETGFRAYNYGVSGQSPANMLTLFQTVNLRKQVAEIDGVAFYTFIGDHLARATPSTFWAFNTNGFLPYVNPETGVVEGTYAQKHPIRMRLIRWMYRSHVVNLFRINFPKYYSTRQYQRFVDLIRKSKELYQKQFGNDNFYVVVFPNYPMDAELRQLFRQAHLRVIDYSGSLTWRTAPDGMHPDADAYRRVARKMAQDVTHPSDRPVAFVR